MLPSSPELDATDGRETVTGRIFVFSDFPPLPFDEMLLDLLRLELSNGPSLDPFQLRSVLSILVTAWFILLALFLKKINF